MYCTWKEGQEGLGENIGSANGITWRIITMSMMMIGLNICTSGRYCCGVGLDAHGCLVCVRVLAVCDLQSNTAYMFLIAL